jgi:G:T-mismatch repair DNA endonuclease (very short patch repair protein)
MEALFLKSLVKRYNNEPNIDNWLLLENYIEDKHFCMDCGGSIFYHNSKMRVSKEGVLYYDKLMTSCKTFKNVDGKRYYLKICQKCISKKFPEYNSMNKSRVFNVMNKITQYAFDIPELEAKKFTKTTAVTLENLINKYGESEGLERWERYRKLQAETNTFEYKRDNYGWDRKDFEEFNKSRAVTLKNMIKKHGEEEGTKVFNQYVEKQRVNGKSISWFIEKHGEIKGREIFNNMLKGKLKGINGVINSKPSVELFINLDNILENKYEIYYFNKNKEFEVVIEETGNVYYLDFFIKELNVCIEFFGDYYHCNPKKYKDPNSIIKFSRIYTVGEIWERDRRRIENLKKYKGIKTIVVWESDFYNNRDNEEFYKKIIKECIRK